MDRRWSWIGLAYGLGLALVDGLAYARVLPVVRFDGYDTVMHFLLIGVAGYVLHRALGRRSFGWIPLGFVIIAVVAGIEEALQSLSPARTASVLDLVADLAGLATLAWIDGLLGRPVRRLDRAAADQ